MAMRLAFRSCWDILLLLLMSHGVMVATLFSLIAGFYAFADCWASGGMVRLLFPVLTGLLRLVLGLWVALC